MKSFRSTIQILSRTLVLESTPLRRYFSNCPPKCTKIVCQNNFLIPRRKCEFRRNFHVTSKRQNLKTPDLIYFPHVVRWLKTKFRFKYIQKTLDPEFSEGAFIYGSTHAVCKITEIISEDKPDHLEGLLTPAAQIHLRNIMANKLTPQQKQIISIKPDDIKILVPTNVRVHNEGIRKTFAILLRSLALKWYEEGIGHFKLVLVALETEFVRHYTEGRPPSDWTISLFNILECAMLTESSSFPK